MNKKIILVLVGIIAAASVGLYAIWRGPVLFLKPPSEERIAFVSDRGGHPDLWTMRTDGTDKCQVTDDAAHDGVPTWSPDAREILSVSDRKDGKYQVFVAAWNGTYNICLTTGTGTKDMPVWGRKGEKITYISNGMVFVTARHGMDEQQFLPPSLPAGLQVALPYRYAAWSPDHSLLLCVQQVDKGIAAFAVELGDTPPSSDEEIKPTFIALARYTDAKWAPSNRLVAAAFINSGGVNGLIISDLDLLSTKELFVSKGDKLGPLKPAWSPDGKRIAFEMWQVKEGRPETCTGIYVVNASGGEVNRIVSGDAREPCWSPDGKRIAYTLTREDGKRDVWCVNSDGSGAVNLTDGKGDNHSPAWSPLRGKS